MRVMVPDTTLVREAHACIKEIAPESIVNHSLRVFALGCAYAERKKIEFDAEHFAIACLLHDLGMVRVDGRRPFPNVGSRALAEMCRDKIAQRAIDEMTDAIDFHFLPWPRWKLGSIVGLLEIGAYMDVSGFRASSFRTDVESARASHPPLDFKRCFYRNLFRTLRSPSAVVGLLFPGRWATSKRNG